MYNKCIVSYSGVLFSVFITTQTHAQSNSTRIFRSFPKCFSLGINLFSTQWRPYGVDNHGHHWFMLWLDDCWTTSLYLNQWWLSSAFFQTNLSYFFFIKIWWFSYKQTYWNMSTILFRIHLINTMTSSNGNIPHTKAIGAEFWCFLWSVRE